MIPLYGSAQGMSTLISSEKACALGMLVSVRSSFLATPCHHHPHHN
jgi:hypothetical protein